MRFVFLSDIHANLEALEAVLNDIEAGDPPDAWCCLGDVVGYGPDPLHVLERLQAIEWKVRLRGNHDQAVIDNHAPGFGHHAAEIAYWTRKRLEGHQDTLAWLASAPITAVETAPPIACYHGSPRSPIEEYILPADVIWNQGKLRDLFRRNDHPVTLVGHSHMPGAFCSQIPDSIGRFDRLYQSDGSLFTLARPGFRLPGLPRWTGMLLTPMGVNEPDIARIRQRRPGLDLPEDIREHFAQEVSRTSLDLSCPMILNVGSVGQPRDGDPRACYLTLDIPVPEDSEDDDAWAPFAEDAEPWRATWHRVPYDHPATSAKSLKLDNPAFQYQASRLSQGY